MANINKMICRLINHVETEEGDFIPAGTPVQVLQWSDKGKTILVRCSSYMFSYGVEDDKLGSFHGAIGKGLCIEVDPQNLQFKESFSFNAEIY